MIDTLIRPTSQTDVMDGQNSFAGSAGDRVPGSSSRRRRSGGRLWVLVHAQALLGGPKRSRPKVNPGVPSVGKRVRANPSRVRISHPPLSLTCANAVSSLVAVLPAVVYGLVERTAIPTHRTGAPRLPLPPRFPRRSAACHGCGLAIHITFWTSSCWSIAASSARST
jgi:hypothetical protein